MGESQYFVTTAFHLFDETGIDPACVGFSDDPVRGDVQTFGQMQCLWPTNRSVDIAALELLDPDVISTLQRRGHFLGVENVAVPTVAGTSFLTGFPERAFYERTGQVYAAPFTIYSRPLPDVPSDAKEPVIEGLDMFFEYGREAVTLDGQAVPTPHLGGTSGASVWQLQPLAQNTFWTAERAVRVIGVQSAFAHSEYFRAQNWWAVARLLAQLDSSLEQHLAAVLNPHVKTN